MLVALVFRTMQFNKTWLCFLLELKKDCRSSPFLNSVNWFMLNTGTLNLLNQSKSLHFDDMTESQMTSFSVHHLLPKLCMCRSLSFHKILRCPFWRIIKFTHCWRSILLELGKQQSYEKKFYIRYSDELSHRTKRMKINFIWFVNNIPLVCLSSDRQMDRTLS